jgi:hypothetical protein
VQIAVGVRGGQGLEGGEHVLEAVGEECGCVREVVIHDFGDVCVVLLK